MSADDDGIRLCPVCGVERDLPQIQHLQNIGVAHLVLQRDSQEIKILYGILGLDGKQRDLLFPHDLV